jgi:hypothetical protein
MATVRQISRRATLGVFLVAGVTAVATARQTAAAGAVTGVGNFSHIVSNIERSVRFYREVLGLELDGAPRLFSGDAAMRVSNALGAQALFTRLPVPGSRREAVLLPSH